MRNLIKLLFNLISQIIVLPLVVASWLEKKCIPNQPELVFNICTNIVALLPGVPGVFLRRAFYTMSLEKCSPHCHIGFGTIISHRCAIIEKHAYIGSYALIGKVHLGEYCLIGSRVSLLSGEALHELDENGMWTPYSADLLVRVTISKNVWIGEGAIVYADVAESSMIGAGAVVSSNIKANIMVAGNPARFVKKLEYGVKQND
jgi:acetyltransferase-like isoleucine patch superfamily enzyme